jgi:hypothetical protein
MDAFSYGEVAVHGRKLAAMVLQALFVLPLVGNATAGCDVELATGRAIAQGLSVSVEAQDRTRVGQSVTITWRNESTEHPQAPTYFVLTTPAEVRFLGTGFMALAAGAKGPRGLEHGHDSTRAFVPLHRAVRAAKGGNILVYPYRRGAQVISWAVVTLGACGEHVFGRGEKIIDVAPGAPEIVVQDRFADDHPLKRIRSLAGTHDLLVFRNRYEVREVATETKVIERPGVEPNFSPTGRFVAARPVSGGPFEIIDLMTRRLQLSGLPTDDQFLIWIRQDSYVIFGGDFYSTFSLWSTLIDNSEDLLVNASELPQAGLGNCRVCKPWDVRLVLNMDDGFAAQATSEHSGVIDLFEPKSDTSETENSAVIDLPDPKSDNSETAAARDYVRNTFDPSHPHFQAWDLGEPLTFSHAGIDVPKGFGHLINHLTINAPDTAKSSRELHGRLTTGRGGLSASLSLSLPDANHNEAFARLASAGLRTRPLLTIEHATSNSTVPPLSVSQVLNDIRAKVPPQGRQLGPERECYSTSIDVFQWRAITGDQWLVKHTCSAGRLEDAHTDVDLYLFSEGSPNTLTLEDMFGKDDSLYLTGHLGSQRLPEIQMRVYRISERFVAVAALFNHRVAVLDIDARQSVTVLDDLVDASLLAEIRLTEDGGHLTLLNSDGRFSVNRIGDGKRVLIGAYVDDEVVVATDDGLYDATYEGAQAVQVRFPGYDGLFRFNQFETMLRRPGLAADVLMGRLVAPPPALVPAPPIAELRLVAAASFGRRTGKVLATSERELAAVRLYVDGRLVEQVAATGTSVEAAVDIADPGGGRWITAIAVDSQGLLSQPSAVLLPGNPRPHGTLRAVLVGVNEYEDGALPRLTFAKSDARRIARALKARERKAVQTVRTTLLSDADITPARVLAAVQRAAHATGPEDMLVIFYAGHGIDGNALGQSNAGLVLTTPKTRMEELKTTALPWIALSDALADVRGTVVIILDACHAGIAGRDAFTSNDDAVSALITRAGSPIAVLAGSKGRQRSYESDQAGAGLFTAAVADAIAKRPATSDRRHSGLINLSELYTAVKTRVVKETNGRQTPWLTRNSLVGEMAVF